MKARILFLVFASILVGVGACSDDSTSLPSDDAGAGGSGYGDDAGGTSGSAGSAGKDSTTSMFCLDSWEARRHLSAFFAEAPDERGPPESQFPPFKFHPVFLQGGQPYSWIPALTSVIKGARSTEKEYHFRW